MAYSQPDSSPFLRVRKTTKGKGRNFLSTEEGAGMTPAGVRKYRAENPGSKLKIAVTGSVKPGSIKLLKEESLSALDPKAGLVKEVKLLVKDGNAK